MPAEPLKFEKRDDDTCERYIATDAYGREFKIWHANDHGGTFGLSINYINGDALDHWVKRYRGHLGIIWMGTMRECKRVANEIACIQMHYDVRNPPNAVPDRGDRVTNVYRPSLSLLAKLGSIIVHVEEAAEPGGHEFDMAACRQLLLDPEVRQWRHNMGALLPRKRSAR